MKPVHDQSSVGTEDTVGFGRPETSDPVRPDHEEQTRREVEIVADTERAMEETGYGYGV